MQSNAGVFARIVKALRATGKPIPTNDIWIAALSIRHNAPLYSCDAHFAQIPMLDFDLA